MEQTPARGSDHVTLRRFIKGRSVASYAGWAIVAGVVLFIVAGLATNGIHLGGGETATAASASGDSAVITALKAICPFH